MDEDGCLHTSMELILIPNHSLLNLHSNDKAVILGKQVIAIKSDVIERG